MTNLKSVVAKGEMDFGSPFHCGTCGFMTLAKKRVDRFGVREGEVIDVEMCDGKEIRTDFLLAAWKFGLCCHSEIRPLLEQAMASKPDFICTLQRPGDAVNPDKKMFCWKKNPGDHCLTIRNGNTCFYLAKKMGTGYHLIVER